MLFSLCWRITMVERNYKTKARWKYELQMQDRKDRKARPITLPTYKCMDKKKGYDYE